MRNKISNDTPPLTYANLWAISPLNSPTTEVILWRINLNERVKWNSNYLSLLHPSEVKQVLRYRQSDDQLRYTATRVVLRHLLSITLRVSPDEIKILKGKYGKPYVDNGPYFNVSHSKNQVLIALSYSQPVGVDIEYKRTISDLELLALRVCSKVELSKFNKHYLNEDIFYRLWTAKEAVLKAKGYGISRNMRGITIDPNLYFQYLCLDEKRADQVKIWRLAVPEGYTAALALATID